MAAALDDATREFIDAFGQLVSDGGLPPSIGRVLGLLVISEEAQLSAEAIGETLQLSTGTVSTALNMLITFRYVKRISKSGARRYYYQFIAESWQSAIDARLAQMRQGIELANKGLALRPNDARLLCMRDLYEQIYNSVKDIKIRY